MKDRLEEAARGALYVLRWQIGMMEDGHIKSTFNGHEATNESISQFLKAATDLEAALAGLALEGDEVG